ncbi:alpha/beta hydrolase [Paraurantiacibacter namhicola]|uniref:Carboxylesterase NlhH n=1 Tax=Paraurantiacibacter namhicola TaxID=645517 RepID=A0A1C7D643_9SPHN|nr:alpha/beta hydrolase [Paraurantiacibacter namhicola]ANU06822.1 Carboxylesterase NlhH [Paraurantiacibacter namhicola]
MSETRGRRGCMKGVLVSLLLTGGALFLAYRWAVGAGSVGALDGIDKTLAGGPDYLVHEEAFGDHPAQRLYVFRPQGAAADAALPVVIFIHGGGWTAGDPADYGFAGRRLAEMGYVAVIPGYRLSEAGIFPAMLEDGASTVRWTVDNIARFGGDPGRIYASGHSAGAYNAVMLALDRQWLGREGLGEDTLKGIIGLAGPYDFLPFNSDGTKLVFGQEDDPERTQPVNFARAGAPPMLLLTGTEDTVVELRNSRSLTDALEAAGSPVQLVKFEGMDHVQILTTIARPFSYRDERVLRAMAAFLPDPASAAPTPQAPASARSE